jgi:hypothetical protein
VLAENEATESGITYDDRTGVSYQYPKAYRRAIQPGERFVYYRGRKKRGAGRWPQVYFGTGIVGAISDDSHEPTRLVCEVLDYEPFLAPVPFKDANGTYLEAGATRRGYFQRGVRRISEAEFNAILTLAGNAPSVHTTAVASAVGNSHQYASPELARAVEEFSVGIAIAELRRRYPDGVVTPQPRNNPGFDILVNIAGENLFVEVKGTERSSPQFFVTEGELQFSRSHADRFRLIVVYRINLESRTHAISWHEGAISPETGFHLKPVQWACATVPGIPPSV